VDTASCIAHYPWRTLAALAAVYDVTCHHHRPKEQVAQELADAIQASLPQTLAALDTEARAALRALTQAEGLAIPRSDFAARFGPLHPYRPWNPKAQPAPWPTPSSPAAALIHYGLAYALDLGSRRYPFLAVLLPHDLLPAIIQGLGDGDRQQVVISRSQSPVHTLYSIDTEVFVFLSFLNRQDISVRHGRWLPPRALTAINAHLHPPDDLGAGRSELQAARIPFIHYLAESAGLVGLSGNYLKPTLAAQDWLATPSRERLKRIWDAWHQPTDKNRALWRRYRLPVLEQDEDPLARFSTLLSLLAFYPPGPLDTPANLVDALAERRPEILRPQMSYERWAGLDPSIQADFLDDARALLIRLLTGPLVWFGVLGQDCKSADRRTDNSMVSVPSPLGSLADLSLTPLGGALLGRDDGEWPSDPIPTPLQITISPGGDVEGSTVLLDVPVELMLADRFALESIVPPDPDRPGRYRLDRAHLLDALQRGHTIEGVVSFLERVSEDCLPAPALGGLYRWAEAFEDVTIRRVVLLQARDASKLREITAQRRLRETLGGTLNARTVEVRADRLDALLRRLAHQDIVPRLDLADAHLEMEGSPEHTTIAVALLVHAQLADALGLPAGPIRALARRRREALSLPLRDAVDHAVAQTLEALHRASPVELEDRLPAPAGPLIEALEAAIRDGCTVEIDYYTAGRAHRTTRRVDPLRIEWRGEVAYLIAHCYLKDDQRVFRVDRIERVEQTGGPTNWQG
jgi:hypothetical protein